MKPHANSHDNDAEHHLYEIFDVERDGVYKYGISGKPLLPDGTSPRVNEQILLFNRLVGMARFFGKVLMIGIPGRKRAEAIEQEYVDAFRDKYGHNPPGNL